MGSFSLKPLYWARHVCHNERAKIDSSCRDRSALFRFPGFSLTFLSLPGSPLRYHIACNQCVSSGSSPLWQSSTCFLIFLRVLKPTPVSYKMLQPVSVICVSPSDWDSWLLIFDSWRKITQIKLASHFTRFLLIFLPNLPPHIHIKQIFDILYMRTMLWFLSPPLSSPSTPPPPSYTNCSFSRLRAFDFVMWSVLFNKGQLYDH